jgi:hypothetical protein
MAMTCKSRPVKVVVFAAAIALTGAAAHAQSQALRDAAFRTPVKASRVVLPIGNERPEPRLFGVAKTSLDHQFDRNATGAVGFLCGIQPKADNHGAANAYGDDPHGRFLGMQLHMSFK